MSRFERPLLERLRQHAREKPDAAAYIWNDQTVTWAELDRASDAFAARLQALGVKKGDPVAMFLGNCPQYVMAHFGIQTPATGTSRRRRRRPCATARCTPATWGASTPTAT
jgi:acyl-CoA synthetase (AMP-forming)/AMP-acid ligase II